MSPALHSFLRNQINPSKKKLNATNIEWLTKCTNLVELNISMPLPKHGVSASSLSSHVKPRVLFKISINIHSDHLRRRCFLTPAPQLSCWQLPCLQKCNTSWLQPLTFILLTLRPESLTHHELCSINKPSFFLTLLLIFLIFLNPYHTGELTGFSLHHSSYLSHLH